MPPSRCEAKRSQSRVREQQRTVTTMAGSSPDFLEFTGVPLHDASDVFLSC